MEEFNWPLHPVGSGLNTARYKILYDFKGTFLSCKFTCVLQKKVCFVKKCLIGCMPLNVQ